MLASKVRSGPYLTGLYCFSVHDLLTPVDYVDSSRYDREVEEVLAAGWLPVCRADQLDGMGDRIAITLLGRPLVVVRDQDELRVLGNVCAHRGEEIARGHIVESENECALTVIALLDRSGYLACSRHLVSTVEGPATHMQLQCASHRVTRPAHLESCKQING